MGEICKHCGMSIDIRNPSGYCDHLYYPDNCDICRERLKGLSDYEFVQEIVGHTRLVAFYIAQMISKLMARAGTHDRSKLEEPEYSAFKTVTPRLKTSTFGSEEYKQALREIKPAIDHHYSQNRHHPEYFANGIKDMNLVDLMEMVCDWTAASLRNPGGDVLQSIEQKQKSLGFSDDVKSLLINTAKTINQQDKENE